jgi:HEPN domain-containing protein
MDEALREVVQAWLQKSSSDLRAARILSEDAEAPLDAAAYHCQQAAEKALKGYLAFEDHPLVKTHDLKLLVPLCASYEAGFEVLLADAELLTPFAVQYRYPDPDHASQMEPTRLEFDEALAAARRMVDFVLAALPEEVHPCKGPSPPPDSGNEG